MKIYKSPQLTINRFDVDDIITTSGIGLKNGGEKGSPEKASFNDLFGKQ